MYPVFLDVIEPEPLLESIGGSLFGIFLGIAVVILVALVVVWRIVKNKKKK